MSCRCPKTIAFLRSIGATHAAAMHENPRRQWSAIDWLKHMKEEEDFLLPMFPTDIAQKIFADHVIFKNEITKYGKIISNTSRHSELEDAWVAVLASNRDQQPRQ